MIFNRAVLFFVLLAKIMCNAANSNFLLICLNNSEDQEDLIDDPSIDNIVAAINQKSFPIIVSANLLWRIKKPVLVPPSQAEIVSILESKDQETKNKAFKIMLYYMDYYRKIETEWVIKEINPSLYLLLPHAYLKTKNIKISDAMQTVLSDKLTLSEQCLGLKINHLKTIEMMSTLKLNKDSEEHISYFVPCLNNFFISNKDYKRAQIASEAIPSTVILMQGHGEIGEEICGLSLTDFKAYLDFLALCNIKLFVYQSCYAAGLNHNKIYKEARSGVQKIYNYPIVTMAITDAPIHGILGELKQDSEKIFLKESEAFKKFAEEVTAKEIIDYAAVMKLLEPGIITVKNIESSSQIRYPGQQWFSVIDRNVAISLGSIIGKTRTKPLDIAIFFKNNNPKMLLLYPEIINFEIKITTKEVPKYISMIPGYAIHKLIKISAPKLPLEKILKAFITRYTEKKFFIKEIEGTFSPEWQAKLNLENKQITLTNVLVELKDEEDITKIYFVLAEKIYIIPDSDAIARIAEPEEIKEYELLLEKTKGLTSFA